MSWLEGQISVPEDIGTMEVCIASSGCSLTPVAVNVTLCEDRSHLTVPATLGMDFTYETTSVSVDRKNVISCGIRPVIIDDVLTEDTESFELCINPSSEYTISVSVSRVSIIDNDGEWV